MPVSPAFMQALQHGAEIGARIRAQQAQEQEATNRLRFSFAERAMRQQAQASEQQQQAAMMALRERSAMDDLMFKQQQLAQQGAHYADQNARADQKLASDDRQAAELMKFNREKLLQPVIRNVQGVGAVSISPDGTTKVVQSSVPPVPTARQPVIRTSGPNHDLFRIPPTGPMEQLTTNAPPVKPDRFVASEKVGDTGLTISLTEPQLKQRQNEEQIKSLEKENKDLDFGWTTDADKKKMAENLLKIESLRGVSINGVFKSSAEARAAGHKQGDIIQLIIDGKPHTVRLK